MPQRNSQQAPPLFASYFRSPSAFNPKLTEVRAYYVT